MQAFLALTEHGEVDSDRTFAEPLKELSPPYYGAGQMFGITVARVVSFGRIEWQHANRGCSRRCELLSIYKIQGLVGKCLDGWLAPRIGWK
jgi:hypothetical protein